MADTERPRIEHLAETQCWALLEQQRVGRLAVAANNKPDIFPVNYVVDAKRIVIRTAPGHKLAAAVLGTAVAFEIDAIDEAGEAGWSIVVKGTANEIETLDDYLYASDLNVEPWAGGAKMRFMQIIPESVTGRAIPSVVPPSVQPASK